MGNISTRFLVLSGKGGVGKSTIAVNLAVWLSMHSKNVGLLDIDIHGPSIPKLLNLQQRTIYAQDKKIKPLLYNDTLKIISIGFLLPNDCSAVIWRGPMKHNLIKKFITEVDWGQLDYLVVDCPPGTGDEPLSIVQLLGGADGAIIVTTPQQLSVIDVRKCISFCQHLNLPILGIIENMSSFICPYCHQKIEIFKGRGGQQIAREFDVPFLASIPIDPDLACACDAGKPFIQNSKQTLAIQNLISVFEMLLRNHKQNQDLSRRSD